MLNHGTGFMRDGQHIPLEEVYVEPPQEPNAPNTPDHYWYQQGKDDGIQSEREAIVAWLRRTMPSSIADLHDEATAIERGDHRAG